MNPTDPPAIVDHRIPVYLLTGYLGSGKTSLLKAWLAQPALKDAALVINELGEVGLDNQILSAASESSALVANACVCCTGLPGLAEALEDLFWARLERRIPRFPHLVIETTGLAEPGPVVQALNESDLLRERYRIAGVITCLSAATADAVLGQHAEARAQLAGADVLVITKTDLVEAGAVELLQHRLQHQVEHELAHHQEHRQELQVKGRAKLRVLTSAHASLTAQQMLQALSTTAGGASAAGLAGHAETVEHAHAADHGVAHGHLQLHDEMPDHGQEHRHRHHSADATGHPSHAHTHSAQAYWWALPGTVQSAQLLAQICDLHANLGTALLRLKGRVRTEQGACLVQMAPFETAPTVQADTLAQDAAQATGLTLIVAQPLQPAQRQLLDAVLGSA
jgi:G3E family GTPase